MSYKRDDLNYYRKNPNLIHVGLDIDLLLDLIELDASYMRYIQPQNIDFIKKAFERNSSIFNYVDKSKITINFLEHVIDSHPMFIKGLYSPSPEIIKLAILKDSNVYPHIEKYVDYNMIKYLLSKNGMLLEFIPTSKQTEDLVMIAIQENINAYQFAGIKTKKTDIFIMKNDPSKIDLVSNYWPELIEEFIRYNPRLVTKFYDTPDFLTKDMIKLALRGDPELFKTIPNPDMDIMKYTIDLNVDMLEFMNYSSELIKYAIKKNGLALKFVKKKDLKTIKDAISQNVFALDYVEYPRNFLTSYAFRVSGLGLKYLENPTYDQCLDAVKRNPYSIEFVPSNHRNKDLQMYALMGGKKLIPFIGNPVDDEVTLQILRIDPSHIFKITTPTDDMFITAFSVEGRLMTFYTNWNQKFNSDVISAALKNDGTIFEDVVDKTKKLALIAISQYPPALQWTVGFQDSDIINAAIQKDPRTIFFADKKLLTFDMIKLAIQIDPDYFKTTSGEITWEQWINKKTI